MLRLEYYRELADKCSSCGYCQAVCPVFREDLLETHLPRARVKLIRESLIEKTYPVTPRLREIIDRCLLCTSCTNNCPTGIPADEIITAARIELAGQAGLGAAAKRAVMKNILGQRGLAGLLTRAGSIAQKLNLGPKDVPQLASRPFDSRIRGKVEAKGEKRATVAYFVGCGTNFIFPETGEDTVKVLTRNGVEVLIPQGQVCCGIPSLAEGDLSAVQEAVRTNVELFSGLDVDAVVTDCTSCGMMFKVKAAKTLPANDPLQEKIAALAAKTFEVTEYLDRIGLAEVPEALNTSFTYHVPCHRGWSPTVVEAPRRVLSQVAGLEAREMEEPGACCGAAGTFYLQHPDLSNSIRSHKIEDIQATGAETVITQCPVCRFYLAARLDNKKVLHPVNLLAQAYGAP